MAPPSSRFGERENSRGAEAEQTSPPAPTTYGTRPYVGQYAPQQQPPTPQPKNHTLRNVLLSVLAVAIIVAIAGGVWSANQQGSAADEKDKRITYEEAQRVPGEANNNSGLPGGSPDKPLAVTPGQAFRIGAFHYAEGWSVKSAEGAGGLTDINGLTVTNTSKESAALTVTVAFHKGGTQIGSTTCAAQVAAEQQAPLQCVGLFTSVAGHDQVTINELF